MSDFRTKRPTPLPVKRPSPVPTAIQAAGQEKRRGVRVNSRVPVSVEWNTDGEPRRGETQTRVVGPYGCLIVLPHYLGADQRIQVTNLVSSRSNPAVVVWCGNERAEGWELGIELINPEMNFWGLDL